MTGPFSAPQIRPAGTQFYAAHPCVCVHMCVRATPLSHVCAAPARLHFFHLPTPPPIRNQRRTPTAHSMHEQHEALPRADSTIQGELIDNADQTLGTVLLEARPTVRPDTKNNTLAQTAGSEPLSTVHNTATQTEHSPATVNDPLKVCGETRLPIRLHSQRGHLCPHALHVWAISHCGSAPPFPR